MKNILDLNSKEIRKYFMDSSSYLTLNLPSYYDFSDLLHLIEEDFSADTDTFRKFQKVEKKKKPDGSIEDKKVDPSWVEDINHSILIGKGNHNEWRKITLIHPVLYVSLVNKISQSKNWSKIKKILKNSPDRITVSSIPCLNDGGLTDSFVSIKNWKDNFERKSIELSNKYKLLFETDVSNCYGSIYTHAIPWAIEGKEKAKKNRNKKTVGNSIDEHIRAINYGQTNGIPQGSILMDLIAEIVLSYIDKNVSDRIDGLDYEILRYRDDIRIFVNSQEDGKKILKILSEELIKVGMSLNKSKTKEGVDVILGSIKQDRLKLLPISYQNLSAEDLLLFSYSFLNENKNSGRIYTLLNTFYKKFVSEVVFTGKLSYYISLLVEIAYKNKQYFDFIILSISKILSFVNSKAEKEKYIEIIIQKFKDSNSNFEDIWLQRLFLKLESNLKFDEKLCNFAKTKIVSDLWNFDWVSTVYRNKYIKAKIVNKKELKNIGAIISDDEIDFIIPS